MRAGVGRRRRKYGDASFVYVMAQFYPWFNFNYLLFFVLGSGNVWYEFKTKENKNETKDKFNHNIYLWRLRILITMHRCGE